ncbi:hypothetical protein STEG23_009166 [Scotinomys teguina]
MKPWEAVKRQLYSVKLQSSKEGEVDGKGGGREHRTKRSKRLQDPQVGEICLDCRQAGTQKNLQRKHMKTQCIQNRAWALCANICKMVSTPC